ncbi:deleted in malignant brain tumors 1 protein-like [Poecilia formosa]|uniref:deleted in malignant brain tumors 1 protein-like n=1 Tax=Poecilia formosa TaxID=48698 RepID=UPI0007B8AA98|nr:PREDICTED: deleted in malignant brain tumors 1 protein-like [Poecilia formosa]
MFLLLLLEHIRLAGAESTQCSGRVEVYHNNVWGTVCDDGWSLTDAHVVCRQMGCGPALTATSSATFGEGTGQIWLDDVSCFGNEVSLTDCQHPGFGTHNCGHGEDAGVICSEHIRLAGAESTQCSGRVEVYHNNVWGTVCDDGWSLTDAHVVCRQMGCGPALTATSSATFGEGTGQIWLDDVSCFGNEVSLTDCQHPGFGTHNCGHGEDAGVICSEIPLFIVLTQSETSITLQWSAITTSFVLQYDGTETNINAPDGAATVTYTVSSLTAGTIYTFTLYTVIGNGRNSGQQLTAVTAPQNTGGFTNSAQDECSITLQWNKINISTSFVLQYDGIETNINAPDGDGPVIHTVSSLTAGTRYTFTLFSVFESIRSSGVQLTAVTTPQNAEGFTNSGQNESSITLQWNKINNNGFVLQYDGIETNISSPDGDGPVIHTVSSLTAGTRYTFTLFSVFEGIRSSGVQLTAVTAPQNAEGFQKSGQYKSSITLQWNKINNNTSFVLQCDGTETNISVPDGDGPVIHTVSSLIPGTRYTFSLFSVFESIRSSGVQLVGFLEPTYIIRMKLQLNSQTQLSDSEMEDVLVEFFKAHGLSQFSLKVRIIKP